MRTVAAGAAATVLVIGAAVAWPVLASWLALAVSIPALAMAYLALIKARMLEFCPEVLGGDVILPRDQRPQDGVRLLLPLQFTNAGYADGIIEWIALRVTVDGHTDGSLLLSPGCRGRHAALHPGQAAARREHHRAVHRASPSKAGARSPSSCCSTRREATPGRAAPAAPGALQLRAFHQGDATRAQPKLERTFEHVLEQKHIEDYSADSTVYLINYQISLHGVRRSLAGPEWLPRAQAN